MSTFDVIAKMRARGKLAQDRDRRWEIKPHEVLAWADLLEAQADCNQIKDKVNICSWQRKHDSWYIISDDFTYDVALQVSGDFVDNTEKNIYCDLLVEALNNNNIPGSINKTKQDHVIQSLKNIITDYIDSGRWQEDRLRDTLISALPTPETKDNNERK